MHVTDITARVTEPADQFDSDWNWAEAATAAWFDAARDAGIVIEDYNIDYHGPSTAVRVRVGGTWYDVIGNGDGEFRAVEVDDEGPLPR